MNSNQNFNIDNLVNNKELNILKAIFPLMPASTKRFISVYIALKELSNISYLLNYANSNISFQNSSSDDSLDFQKIFEAIKKFLSPSEIENIENYLNIMNIFTMYNDMNDEDGGFNIDMLKSMLPPEQNAMFEAFSTQNSND